jgi:hypothetical protein
VRAQPAEPVAGIDPRALTFVEPGLTLDFLLVSNDTEEGEMARTAALATLVITLAALLAGAAVADPLNQNSAPITFACDNGVTFTGTGTIQSHTSTGHVIAASDSSLLHSVFQAVQITVDGQIVKQIPGFAGRNLISCTITAFGDVPATGPVIIASGFFTGPR